MAAKKIRPVIYICGFEHCQYRIMLPKRGDACYYTHKDMNGLKCNGLLVRYQISPIGRAEEIQERWFKTIFPERHKTLGETKHGRYIRDPRTTKRGS